MKENKFSSLSDLRVGQSIVIPNYHKRKEEIYFIWPVRGEIINSFGENVGHIINNGLNIKVKSDDSVLASAEGKTLYANYLKGWGKTIVLKHARDFYTVYANLNNIQVREGSDVKRGEVIGKISSAQGNNGYILHFEIRKSHIPQNPLQYLK
jgi:septal ring factor EnvC (AmiA/AmiB activator)